MMVNISQPYQTDARNAHKAVEHVQVQHHARDANKMGSIHKAQTASADVAMVYKHSTNDVMMAI